LWVRNALIRNTNPIWLRSDIWWMRENFVISERIKHLTNTNHDQAVSSYFWRTSTQQEVDYIEEIQWHLTPYEIKRSSHKKASLPASFAQHYPSNPLRIINPSTIWEYVWRETSSLTGFESWG
jgi:predicted AAA+ superfamily ATPase